MVYTQVGKLLRGRCSLLVLKPKVKSVTQAKRAKAYSFMIAHAVVTDRNYRPTYDTNTET